MDAELEKALVGEFGHTSLFQTPIDDFLTILATDPSTSAVAVGACLMRTGQSLPPLRALLERAAAGGTLSVTDENLLFRGLHILGGARDSQAFAPLMRLLRRPMQELDHLFGDVITDGLARITAGVFDGDADSLFELIADRTIDEYVRDALWGAATFLTWDGRIERERMVRFIERFDDERMAEDEDYAWIGWLEAVSLLGLRSLEPRVAAAWEDGRIDEDVLGWDHFERDLSDAEQRPDDAGRFEFDRLGYIEDAYAELERWDRIAEDRGDGLDDFQGGYEPPIEPIVNPWRNVGRNDPCPCGSGKKAKKCCLNR